MYNVSQILFMYLFHCICSLAFIPAIISLSLNDNLNGSTVACPGQQVRFVCHANSPVLYWFSSEYIGPPGVRIEFSKAFDLIGTTVRVENAVATLLSANEGNVTSSELVITASQDFPTASVACGDGAQDVTCNFLVPSMSSVPLVKLIYCVYAKV